MVPPGGDICWCGGEEAAAVAAAAAAAAALAAAEDRRLSTAMAASLRLFIDPAEASVSFQSGERSKAKDGGEKAKMRKVSFGAKRPEM